MNKIVFVLGIGRVGLPISLALCEAGYTGYGIDVRPEHIETLLAKKFPFIEKGAKKLLIKTDNFLAKKKSDDFADFDAFLFLFQLKHQ
ncbi:MAG: hypothetical protein J4215_04505 [Candidatus Diapherotrites archaeon]|uniref:UDP-glucose/GDP-mannose dehydrogenase N-terminal domain-containing protein n=1 Tax=Candidatus Iainarchaeum sp. TaxID=3101447 RepID=A0A8T4LEU0_9ARCH|nr:hypothetical protein [Candidatus Diapherotrites archaeon]